MTAIHSNLIGLSNRDLLMRSSSATHQHFKGGLYRLIGTVLDSSTGESLVDADGEILIAYSHEYPYARKLCVRKESEFFGSVEVDGEKVRRFRPLM